MASIYRKYLRLLEKWPVDPSKNNRDLGQYIRSEIKKGFVGSELSPNANAEECSKTYEILNRLADNHYVQRYKRNGFSSSTGLTPEQCNTVLSDDFLEYIKEENTGIFKKLTRKISKDDKNETFCDAVLSHRPVMCNEVLKYLSVEPNSTIVDMTFGGGGHTKMILKEVPNCKIICVDRDAVAYSKAVKLAAEYPDQVIPCQGKFSDLPVMLDNHGLKFDGIDRMLFDFGCSSMQFDSAARGFSISNEGPLDMRMDDSINFTAADVIEKADEEDLVRIFKVYGEEKHSKKIARAVVEARYSFCPIRTTKDLASLVSTVLSDLHRVDALQRPAHPATKIFQALRIFVNNELNEINYAMLLASKYVKIGGRIVTISFHSLEDRIVKRHITSNVDEVITNKLPLRYSSSATSVDNTEIDSLQDTQWLPLTKHVVTPSDEEVADNPRARSAKLRASMRIK